ncbi:MULTISPECIES: lipopolysaccharide biosynthesis protein [unclassified Actinotalea]|uniref:lipopolysaccharide biosynthesis protein n=1 Tax=unclassified Actinotalea TaxID=2638618 RepID=UPI0015F43E8D|nr:MULTISPECIES: hypothetical protein [unclassified Actinotalea]
MTDPVAAGGPDRAAGRTDSATVLGRGALYTLATAGPALAAVAVIPVVTRVLAADQYDLVAVATVVVQVGFILVALGMGAAITRQYVLDAAGAPGARGLVLQAAALATALTLVAASTLGWWAPALLGRPASPALLLAVVACLGGAWMVVAQAYLRGADRAGAFVGLAVTASLAGPAAGLAGLVLLERTATVYLSGVAAGYVLAGLAGLVLALGSGPVRAERAGLRAAMRIGLPTVPHQVSLYVALAGLVVVADRLLDQGGRANVALTIGAGATVVTAGLNNAWAPLVYRAAPERRGEVLTGTTRTIATVTAVLAGGVGLLAPWLLRLAAPASYAPDELVPAVALASAAALPSVVYLASGHLVFARGRTGALALTTPTAVLVGIAVAAWLAPAWGVTAVAVGYLVTYLGLAVLTTLLQRRVADHPWWPPFLPVVTLVWLGVTAAGVVLPVDGAWALARVALALVLGVGGALAVRRGLRSNPAR